MIKLRIGRVSSPDAHVHVWEPDSSGDVYLLLEVEIGVDGEQGSDVFQLMVATPEGLRSHATGAVISERGTLVISDFSWQEVLKAVRNIVGKCSGKDWNDSVLRLQRYFRWEYEDYVQSDRPPEG
jgi:hypothetical protein